MKDVALFTRQRGESSIGIEQETLDAQLQIIEAYAKRMRLNIAYRVAETGSSSHEPFLKLIAYLLQHPDVQGIITYSVDRLCRNFADVGVLGGIIANRKIKLYFAVDTKAGLQDRPSLCEKQWYRFSGSVLPGTGRNR